MAVGVIGLVLAMRRRRRRPQENPNSQPPPPRWGRGGGNDSLSVNYRHAYHAGNFADVLKHVVLSRLIEYLKRKDKAFRVIDTHAGIRTLRSRLGRGVANRRVDGPASAG